MIALNLPLKRIWQTPYTRTTHVRIYAQNASFVLCLSVCLPCKMQTLQKAMAYTKKRQIHINKNLQSYLEAALTVHMHSSVYLFKSQAPRFKV